MKEQNLQLLCLPRYGGDIPVAIGIKVETLPAGRQGRKARVLSLLFNYH